MSNRTVSEAIPNEFDKDIVWLNANITNESNNNDVVTCKIKDLSDAGGLSGASMFKIQLDRASGQSQSLVCKIIPSNLKERSKNLGQPRESIFYESFSSKLKSIGMSIPNTYYCYGDMLTGEKQIILQDLSDCIQSGYFYGNHSPHNWDKNLSALILPCNEILVSPLTEQEWIETITRKAFSEAAKLHSIFWKNEDYLTLDWLRSADWMIGKNEGAWQAAQETAINYWANTKEKIKTKADYTVIWSPLVIECIESSLSKISWKEYQETIMTRQWTLVHGDFHPANMMWKPLVSDDNTKVSGLLYLLDWEMVGFGSGPQDLAQFFISHVSSEARRSCELKLLREYYDAILTLNESITSENFSWEDCKRDYSHGGAERWIWLLPLLAEMCNDKMVQFFHNQLQQFIDIMI